MISATAANEISSLAIAHLRLVVISVTAAGVLGFGLGLVALRRPALERLVLSGASLVQAIPAIALLAAMVPLLAWIGQRSGARISGIGELPALLALTAYAVLPLVRGVVTGVRGIDRAVHLAAAAVGMTDRQRFRLVDLPLAAPAVLAALRTATVWTVGMATLATPVGAASLGNLIFGGLQTRQYDRVGIGCIAAAAIALVFDALLAFAERKAHGRHGARALGIASSVFAVGALVALVAGWVPARSTPTVRIGAKSFTEQLVLAELLRCAVGSDAKADIRPSLGTTVAFDALASGDLDVYVEYTGTAWATILHRSDHPARPELTNEVTRALAADHGAIVVANLGFENAYALVVRGNEPARSIADLGAASERVFAGDYEFFARPEWSTLRTVYGLAPREARPMDPSLMYEALRSRAVDVIAGYTTDGRISTMGLRTLADPKGAVLPYDAVVVATRSLPERLPRVAERLRALAGTVDADTMRRWNAAVDAGTAPAEVVREHRACRTE